MVRQTARERRVLALGRLKTGEMNKTEAAYAERLRALLTDRGIETMAAL